MGGGGGAGGGGGSGILGDDMHISITFHFKRFYLIYFRFVRCIWNGENSRHFVVHNETPKRCGRSVL